MSTMNSTTGITTKCVRFIENLWREEFREHYETYNRLCEDYSTELVDNFAEDFDIDHN